MRPARASSSRTRWPQHTRPRHPTPRRLPAPRDDRATRTGRSKEGHTSYDADGNVLYKNNLVNPNFSELYAYDQLNRLTAFQRGTLNAANTAIVTPNPLADHSDQWTMDSVGNITSSGGISHTENAQNQVTAVGSNGLTYDPNGNMTTDEQGNTYQYNAWNQIVLVNGTYAYKYDALGRRTYEGTTGHDLYYNTSGNVLEERNSSHVVTDQYVWGMGYVNDLVLRDDNSVSGNYGKNGSGLGRRLFAEQDANWNVTSLADINGNTVERFMYDPYGTRTVLSPSWTVTTDPYGMLYGFQGGRTDPISGKVNFQNRDLDTGTDTWTEVDPAGYVDGSSVYASFGDSPVGRTDPYGLFAMDLAFNSFIPLSHGMPAGDGRDFNWFAASYPWSIANYLFTKEAQTWQWFETDNRENPGQKGTSRVHTDVQFDSASIGKLVANGNVTLRTGADLTYTMDATAVGENGNIPGTPLTSVRSKRPTPTSSLSVTNHGCSSTITVNAAAGDPLAHVYAPSIYIVAEWTVSTCDKGKTVTLTLRGTHTKYPAFEGIADGQLDFGYKPTDTAPSIFNLGRGASVDIGLPPVLTLTS